MGATTDSEPDPETLRRATQAAVDATATAYTESSGTDVESRLRAEMTKRDLEVDEVWAAGVARRIRSGHDVRVGLPGQLPQG